MKMDTKLTLQNQTLLMNQPSDLITGLHIEPTNICTLKCSGCARTRFLDQWPSRWTNQNLNIDDLMKFLDIDLEEKDILMCGNYGDPIYHPDLIEMVSQFKQRKANISIVTNGSYKKAGWWESLTDLLDDQDKIIFSVDGTPDNFTQYRVNADWDSIHVAMQIASEANCKTSWKYIPFSFNQTDISAVELLSQQIGIDEFIVAPSDRYDEKTEHLRPVGNLLGTRYQAQQSWKQHSVTSGIDAKCKNNQEHYISADGFYTSCCYIADHRFYYKNMFGKNKKQYSINNSTLTAILKTKSVIDFYQNLENNTGCQYNCPKFIAPIK